MAKNERRFHNPDGFLRPVRQLLPVVGLAFALSGCLNGSKEEIPSNAVVSTNALTLINYDLQNATLTATGTIRQPGANDQVLVRFYATDTCSDTVVGQGTIREIAGSGVTVTLTSSGASAVYYKVTGFNECQLFGSYDASHAAPPTPIMTATSPASPSRTSYQPAISGTTQGVISRIEIFDDVYCSHIVGFDTAENFRTAGIQVNLIANQTSTLYVQAIEPFGNRSTCAQLGTYTHVQIGPNPPRIARISPTSPNNTTTKPTIYATISSDTDSIKLFSDSGCATVIADIKAKTFTELGATINATANGSTSVYAVAYDADGNPSICNYLTTYVHDNVPPAPPSYALALPGSPTNKTIYPMILGLASSDSVSVALFKDAGCISRIGADSKLAFESSGVRASLTPNATTWIYGAGLDAAGNMSSCALMINYVHNTFPPDSPIFGSTSPPSPNNKSTTPLISGTIATGTVSLNFYQDDNCTQAIGSGPASDFDSDNGGAGIRITVADNTITSIFAQPIDIEGNVGQCTMMTNYAHSTLPAPDPGFLQTLPVSPSRLISNPTVIGTAASTLSTIDLYTDSNCTVSVAHTSRIQWVTTGVQVTLPSRKNSAIYAISSDVYGNISGCKLLTNYIHDDVTPLIPAFTTITPTSPTNASTSPLITGTITLDPFKVLPPTSVSLYDSAACVNKLGSGTVTAFTTTGINAEVPANSITSIYGRVFDDAGNYSSCTSLTGYLHDTWPPGDPLLASASPNSPSYTRATTLKGSLDTNKDLLPASLIVFYSDNNCQTQLMTGLPSAFTSTGITLTAPRNQTTKIYAATFDSVGNSSSCMYLLDYAHNDTGPAGIQYSLNPDGSPNISWTPDSVASPSPQYILKRSRAPGGPYSAISAPFASSTYKDPSVSNQTTYYYVVAATNSTGTSLDSAEIAVPINSGSPGAAFNLRAISDDRQILLSWNGFTSDVTYKILRAQQTGGPYTEIKSSHASTSYTDKNLTNGTTYYYVIVGTNPAGDSIYSNEANAVSLTVGNAPTNLVLTAMSTGGPCLDGTGIKLTWSSPDYYDGFMVRRGSSSSAEFNYKAIAAGTNSYTECPPPIGGGAPANLYYYKVAGTWNGANSSDTNEVGISVTSPPTLIVSAGSDRLKLSWPYPTGATSFAIYRASKPGGPYTVVDPAYNSNTYDDVVDGVNVVFGQPYFYYVQTNFANNAVSYPSLEQSGITAADPSAPSNLQVTTDSTRAPALAWSAPAYFNSFNIYRSSSLAGPFTFVSNTGTNSMTTTFVDSAAPAGKWYYQVTAVWGNHESAPVTSSTAYRHGVPATVTATAGSSSIVLTWGSVTGAAQYNVFRSSTSGGSTIQLLPSPTSTTFTDSTASSATGYFYTIQAVFADFTLGEMSAEASAMRTGTNVPSGLTVKSTTQSSVTLTWANVKNATKYNIYKSTSSGGSYGSAVTSSTQNTGTVSSGLMAGMTYYFKVSAEGSSWQSSQSTYVSATTLDTPLAPTVSASENVTVTPHLPAVDICWSSVLGAQSYTVNRIVDGVTSTVSSNATSCLQDDNGGNGLTNGKLYFYTVSATFSGGQTTTSALSSGVTPGVYPLTPSGLTVTQNSTGTSLALSWAFVPAASGYMIYQSTTSGSGYTQSLLAPVSGNTNIPVTGLTPDTTYYFVVISKNGSLDSGYSQEIAVTTAATPAAPTTTVVGNSSVRVTWAPIAGAVAYDLQRSTDGTTFTTLPASPVVSPYDDATAVGGVGYYYRYLPYTDVNRLIPMAVSAKSNPLVTTVTAPLKPTQLRAEVTQTNSVYLNWGMVPIAANYNIYRSDTGVAGTFSLLSTVVTDTFFMPTFTTDATVIGGSTYYYGVTAVNTSGVESPMSDAVSVTIGNPATMLAASAGGNAINLTWTGAAGASAYTVRRSFTSGGPYGIVASGVATNSYTDTTVEDATTYYYVVSGETATGEILPDSNEATAIGSVIMNLQVPIELIDQGLSSDVTPITFERTRTSLDTGYYDGTVSYALEINAVNNDVNPQTVSLIDTAGNVITSIAVAPATNPSYRSRIVFTPVAGASDYRIRLSATANAQDLQVLSARILVTQVGASRTRLYIPLLANQLGVANGDQSAPIESSSSLTFAPLSSTTIYAKNVRAYSKPAATNAFELETLVAASGGATASVTLLNETRNSPVIATQAYFTNATIGMALSPFSEGTTFFDTGNEGDHYSVTIRCEWPCPAGGDAKLYKAGLWVTLDHLKQVEIPFRLGLGVNAWADVVDQSERTRIDLTAFSNPSVSFQAVGSVSMLSPVTIDLMSLGTSDQGIGSLSAVPSSTLSFNLSGKDIQRSPAGLSITGGDRFVPQITFGFGATQFRLLDSTLVINATR